MGVFKEIAKADGSGTTTFYRLSSEEDTVETTSTDGTSTMIDYNSMLNKPSINDVALVGNKTLEDLGIQPAGDYLTAIPEEYITEEELEAKDYATEAFVMEQINNTEHFHREIVDALPLTGKDNVLYLVPKKGSDKDIYNEYIWTGADYEFMGTTAVDLTDYYQKNEVDELLGTKVNKVSGKQLSTNDYTTAEKTKLASLENYDDGELRSKVDALHNYDDTAVKLDIQELKRDTSINEIDIASIENELGYKAEVIRLVKNGDWWLCQDAKGNNLTLEMAMNRLGLPKTVLLLENLENDGKYYPVEYKLQEKYIDIIYKDLDGITHHLNYGYNEYFTNTASGDYIHLEDSINYPYKKLEIDGVCEQETTTGKNLCTSVIGAGTTDLRFLFNKNNFDKTFTLSFTSNETLNGNSIYLDKSVGGTVIVGTISGSANTRVSATATISDSIYTDLLSSTWWNLRVYKNNGNFTIPNDAMIQTGSMLSPYEPYTGEQPSPNPDYPQEIEVITDSISVKSIGKNLLKGLSTSLADSEYWFDINKYYFTPLEDGWGKFEYDNTNGTSTVFINAKVNLSAVALKENTTYTIFTEIRNSNISENSGAFFQIVTSNPTVAFSEAKNLTYNSINTGGSFKTSLKTKESFNGINVAIDSYLRLSAGTKGTVEARVTLVEGDYTNEDLTYEPYKESSIIANLPEGEFIGKIDDTYKDTLKVEYNEEDGQYHLVLNKMICKVVLDGSENWNYQNKTFTIFLDNIKIANHYEDRGTYLIISNYFLKGETNYRDAVQDLHIAKTIDSKGNQIGIKYAEITSLDDFKTWLSTHNTEVYYVLAEPYVLDLGIVDMPITYNGVTNLYTNSDLMPTVNVEYYTEILENAKDNIIGQDIYLQDEVDTLNDLPTKANKGDIRKVKDTESWYIYDGTIWSAFDKASEIDLTNYLSKDNTIPYAPSTDYNPATKRYVDTKVDALFIPTKTSQLTNDSGFVLKSVNDLANYYNKSNTYNKAEVNALVAGGSETSDYTTLSNKPSLVTTSDESLNPLKEEINGEISLNKIAKTGNYKDLLYKPIIPITFTDNMKSDYSISELPGWQVNLLQQMINEYLQDNDSINNYILRADGIQYLEDSNSTFDVSMNYGKTDSLFTFKKVGQHGNIPHAFQFVGSIIVNQKISKGSGYSSAAFRKNGIMIYCDKNYKITAVCQRYQLYGGDKDNQGFETYYISTNDSYTTAYIPTKDYQPATKKYVDDSIPTKTSQLTNDSNYTTLYSVENNYDDGTIICGWSSTATDGQDMTSDYGMTPAMAAGIQAGKKYEWSSRVSYSGTNNAVCYYASHDHGTADDGTSYNYVSAKIGNGTDWISFCWDDSTVYFGTTWPGSSGGKACFSGDTLVWTSEGDKKIKDIQIGDRVMSINIEKDIIEPREITKLVNHKEEEILVITTKDGTIKVTGSHPFYEKKKGKVNARILEVGDELMDDKFGLHKITKIETKALNDTVYEIVVDGTHNYFISKQHIRVFNEPSVLKD